jgi:hypothetical protein
MVYCNALDLTELAEDLTDVTVIHVYGKVAHVDHGSSQTRGGAALFLLSVVVLSSSTISAVIIAVEATVTVVVRTAVRGLRTVTGTASWTSVARSTGSLLLLCVVVVVVLGSWLLLSWRLVLAALLIDDVTEGDVRSRHDAKG